MSTVAPSSKLKSLWQRRVLDLIIAQLKQGITAEKIALTIALGITLGVFPIIGTTMMLCLTVGVWLKLNQPIIQLVNWLASPLQVPMVFVFVRIGEWLTRAKPVSFSIAELFQKFHASPVKFMQEFGITGLRGIGAWAVIAPGLIALLYFTFLTPLRKLAALTAASSRHAD